MTLEMYIDNNPKMFDIVLGIAREAQIQNDLNNTLNPGDSTVVGVLAGQLSAYFRSRTKHLSRLPGALADIALLGVNWHSLAKHYLTKVSEGC